MSTTRTRERYRGRTLLEDHPVVKRYPQCFVVDGTPMSEWPNIFAVLDDLEPPTAG